MTCTDRVQPVITTFLIEGACCGTTRELDDGVDRSYTRKRADLFGERHTSGWVVAEAKGIREHRWRTQGDDADPVTDNSIDRMNAPALAYVCAVHFPKYK